MKIKLVDIILTGWNARKVKKNDPETKELAASIQCTGLIQPITVRKSSTEGKFDLVCGERRWVAHAVAGMVDIDAQVKVLSDAEVKLIMFAENAERKDLTPYEESDALNMLIEDSPEMDPEAAAALLGWDVVKVKRRWVLRNLDKKLRKIIEDDGDVPISVAEHLAAFPAAMQIQWSTKHWSIERLGGLKDARRFTNNYAKMLSVAPFLPSQIYGKQPLCTACPKRTGCNADLFDDSKKDQKVDRCLDGACWDKKVEIHVADSVIAHPDLIQLTDSYSEKSEAYPAALLSKEFDEIKSKAKDNAIWVDGDHAGRTIRIKVRKKATAKVDKQGKPKPAPKDMTKAQAIAELKAKREVRSGQLHKDAMNIMKEAVGKGSGKLMSRQLDHAMGCAMIMGVTIHAHGSPSKCHEFYDKFIDSGTVGEMTPVNELEELIRGKVAYHCGADTGIRAAGLVKLHTALAKFICLDYQNFVDKAKETQKPEPKSWDALKVIAKES